jgi:hypothetical protein
MSALRLSELLPWERRLLEVVHSYAGQRLPGYISDPLVSNKISGNATFYLKFSRENRSAVSTSPSSFVSKFPKRLSGPYHLGNPSQICTPPVSFRLSNKLSLCLTCFHSIFAHTLPHVILSLFVPLCRLGLLASALPEAATAKPRWGVVQPVGHLTVNEDGEGSNPSAPANFFQDSLRSLSPHVHPEPLTPLL